MNNYNYNLNVLSIKNFPDSFTSEDKNEFLKHFGVNDVKISKNKKIVYVSFSNENEASQFLFKLHQMKILDKRLTVEYVTNNINNSITHLDNDKNIEDEQIPAAYQNLNEFVKKLYTLNNDINFSQPPLPYLVYKYPKVNRDIIDSICVALESTPKFYIQVLHLMNRMNLPPPFCSSSKNIKFNEILTDASTQTYNSDDDDDYESELEIEENKNVNYEINYTTNKLKRKKISFCKNKMYRSVIETEKLKNENKTKLIDQSNNELENNINVKKKIKLNIPKEIVFNTNVDNVVQIFNQEEIDKTDRVNNLTGITKDNIIKNRIPTEQQQNLKIFQNYSPGIKSNKLYIKNLAKTTTESDLKQIFSCIDEQFEDIDIKLMQTGRMKGQAFIKLLNTQKLLNDEDIKNKMEIVLQETNGYILNDKPMIVMFGKSD